VSALRGNLTLFIAKAGGMNELLKQYGLPLTLMNMIFFAALFDLLQCLFRNVRRGDSFTPQSVRLVQYLGCALPVPALLESLWRRRECGGPEMSAFCAGFGAAV
jgi:hypothetical protein